MKALAIYNFLKEKHDDLTFDLLKEEFSKTFKTENLKHQLELELQNFKLGSFSVQEHFFKLRTLCQKIDPQMKENTTMRHILDGLPSSILSIVTLWPRKTLAELETSLKDYVLRQQELEKKDNSSDLQKSMVKPLYKGRT